MATVPTPIPPSSERAPGYILLGTALDPVSARECRLVEGGLAIGTRTESIREVGSLKRLRRRYPRWPVIDPGEGTPCVLTPPFADAHVHWVQHLIRGERPQSLLTWLHEVVFPEEAKCADDAYAREVARGFFADLFRQGTRTAMVFSSQHPSALSVFHEMAPAWGHFWAGNVLMDRNVPGAMSTTEAINTLGECAYRFSKRYAVTPRYAPSCSKELLETAGGLAIDDSYMQTHIAETPDEVELVKQAHPGAENYADVYDRAGLLGARSLLAHCIYLTEAEWRLLSALGCIVVHCPTSNEALGSGVMPLKRVRDAGLRWVLGSDVGAGPSLSMLHVMQSFLRVHETVSNVTAVEAFYRATRALPEILRLTEIGRLEKGFSGDVVVHKHPEAARANTPELALRLLCDGTIEELEARPLATIVQAHQVAGEVEVLGAVTA